MKAIVTNIILGSLTAVVSMEVPVRAEVTTNSSEQKTPVALSATVLQPEAIFILPPALIFESEQSIYSISLEDKDYVENLIQHNYRELEREFYQTGIALIEQEIVSLKKVPYLRELEEVDFILGKHSTFWQSENSQKYWGLTTVKTWGGEDSDPAAPRQERSRNNFSLQKLDYIDAAPILAPNSSALTISGGSQKNLVRDDYDLVGELEDFRGGVALHQSLAKEVTVGLGFVYEDFLLGFSQLSYQPEDFPLRTTVSLMQGKDGLEVYSHLKLQPSEAMVLNLYSDPKNQKFDFNWGLVSGLTLTADGNSEQENLRAGAKLDFKNDFFAFKAEAQLDNNNKLQWEVDSQLGNFRLKYATDASKSDTEIKYNLNSVRDSGFQCSLFVKNQTRRRRKNKDEEALAIWGWQIHSTDKVAQDRYRWEINLGYGFGSEGAGAIAHMGAAISPSLSLKLSYEEVSLTNDETVIKLQLDSH